MVNTDTIPDGLRAFYDDMRGDVEDWLHGGPVRRATNLAERMDSKDFRPDLKPQFFTGDVAAALVVVHLNPQANQLAEDQDPVPPARTFDEYITKCTNFGGQHFTNEFWTQKKYRSQFDLKQLAFLRQFGILELSEEHDAEDLRRNLVTMIDAKLQLELVPYPSKAIKANELPDDYLAQRMELLLGVIAAYPRRCVLFCGQKFDQLLKPYAVGYRGPMQTFRLQKNDHSDMKQPVGYRRITLEPHNVAAAIIPSYANKALGPGLLAQYGAECAKRWVNADN